MLHLKLYFKYLLFKQKFGYAIILIFSPWFLLSVHLILYHMSCIENHILDVFLLFSQLLRSYFLLKENNKLRNCSKSIPTEKDVTLMLFPSLLSINTTAESSLKTKTWNFYSNFPKESTKSRNLTSTNWFL